MPKKRKTLKQKIQTEQKQHTVSETSVPTVSTQHNTQVVQDVPTQTTFSLPTEHLATKTIKKPLQETITVATVEYDYLGKDLVKTALLTGAIVLAELVIKLFIMH